MKKNLISIFFLFATFGCSLFSQPITERYKEFGDIYILEVTSAPFPHPKRMDGHNYKNKHYSFVEHYNDSSVALFIPNGFVQSDSTNVIVYFHGWYNNIDKASAQFNLIEQFSESNKNAIFIFPEGPKNSPDSFGGKLEEKNGLKKLIYDVINILVEKGKLNSNNIGNIILSGHSGAYRVISFCLKHGGLTSNISDVILFDALYGNIEYFTHWIENYNGRFIHIYTDKGGTKYKTRNMMNDFASKEIEFLRVEEVDLKLEDLRENRLIFIHTDLSHNGVISKRDQFLKFLETSKIPTIKKSTDN